MMTPLPTPLARTEAVLVEGSEEQRVVEILDWHDHTRVVEPHEAGRRPG